MTQVVVLCIYSQISPHIKFSIKNYIIDATYSYGRELAHMSHGISSENMRATEGILSATPMDYSNNSLHEIDRTGDDKSQIIITTVPLNITASGKQRENVGDILQANNPQIPFPYRCIRDNVVLLTNWSTEVFMKMNISCRLETIKRLAEISTTEINGSLIDISKVLAELKRVLPKTKAAAPRTISPGGLQTKKSLDTIPQPYQIPANKTLAFVKPYKVGSTTVASLLVMSSYVYNLELARTSKWMEVFSKTPHADSTGYCADIVGTYHPGFDFYDKLHRVSPKLRDMFYCKEPLEFMFIRNPIDRLWSGYHHAKRIKPSYSLQTYLTCKGNAGCTTHVAPHMLLSQNLNTAMNLSNNLLMLLSDSQEMMDASLMLLSLKAQMSICDFMYEPCNKNQEWGTSKCYMGGKSIPANERKILEGHVNKSGEYKFYQHILPQYMALVSKTPSLSKRLEHYNSIRDQALDKCSSQSAGYKLAAMFLMLDPRIKLERSSKSAHRAVLSGEGLHTVDARWLCMQWYCHKVVPSSITLN